jgi:hypothetical protein
MCTKETDPSLGDAVIFKDEVIRADKIVLISKRGNLSAQD